MSYQCHIKIISANETHAVRHPMLRQGRPVEDCVFEGDDDLNTLHLGAFINNELIGVLSAYQKKHPLLNANKSYQIRGVAVLEKGHRRGIGSALMTQVENILAKRKVDIIWLNARINALKFYTALAYQREGEPFEIESIGTHYCFYKTF